MSSNEESWSRQRVSSSILYILHPSIWVFPNDPGSYEDSNCAMPENWMSVAVWLGKNFGIQGKKSSISDLSTWWYVVSNRLSKVLQCKNHFFNCIIPVINLLNESEPSTRNTRSVTVSIVDVGCKWDVFSKWSVCCGFADCDVSFSWFFSVTCGNFVHGASNLFFRVE